MSGELDLVCVGRSSVDLYGEQIGCRLEDVSSFAKYVGGCPTNIAVGTARLGLKSGLITRVGDEQLGRFIVETLNAEGVDTTAIKYDPSRLTALVILGIRDEHHFPHIFHRTDCADMALAEDDIDPAYIARARAVLVTGTHLSTPTVAGASRRVVDLAIQSDARVILDIDYRPVLWGLTGHAQGASRFVASTDATERIHELLPDCDLVVGTEEEIRIAGGTGDLTASLCAIRELSDAAIVLKRGAEGCAVFPGEIPARVDRGILVHGFPVKVFNPLGAGDAFMSGFLRGWLRGEDWATSCRFGNAAGALVVSRHGCAPASPTWPELEAVLDRSQEAADLSRDERLNRLHRVTTRRREWPEVWAIAFDHRSQLEELADAAHRPRDDITRLKTLIAEAAARAVEDGPRGALIDDRYGQPALFSLTGRGWWLARPVELPGSRPLEFESGDRLAAALRTWPAEHVAKCLVLYDPDDPAELREQQDQRLNMLYRACADTGHELLLEVIPPKTCRLNEETLARVVERIYARGIYPDWWKLPPPFSKAAWARTVTAVRQGDDYCRGILILGLSATEEELKRGFDLVAGEPLCRGFAVGRSIFNKPAEDWFSGRVDDGKLVAAVTSNYRRVIELWRGRGS